MADEMIRLLETTAARPSAPIDLDGVLRAGRRRRRARRAAIGGLAGLLIVAAVAVLPDTGRTLFIDSAPLTEADLPDGCRLLPDGPVVVTEQGLLGASLGPVVRSAVGGSMTLGPLVAMEVEDAVLEGTWYAVAASVTDADGRARGVATWLSPDALATFASDAGVPFEEWRDDPIGYPEATHVQSVNALASKISSFSGATERDVVPAALSRCAETAAALP